MMQQHEPSRRAVLKRAGLAGAGLAIATRTGWSASLGWFADEDEVVPFADIPDNFNPRRDGKLVRLDLRELHSFITPADEYFAVQHYNVPQVDASQWKLETTGLVSRSGSLSLDELRRRRRVEKTLFFECSGNQARGMHSLMGNARWAGASLRDVLQEAGPSADAREVIFWAADRGEEKIRDATYPMRFARSMSLEDAMGADAILAYEMNGEPLLAAHGFPVRLIVPGWYGIANVKWLERIELSASRFMNRFMGRDYVTVMGRQVGDQIEYTETSVTRMRVKSVVARVTRSRMSGGTLKIFGAAWTEGTPLKVVEVQIDDRAWKPARLEPQPNALAWTFWTVEMPALPPGPHTVVSRATDQAGHVQPASLEFKKTYWEDNAQFRRTIMVS